MNNTKIVVPEYILEMNPEKMFYYEKESNIIWVLMDYIENGKHFNKKLRKLNVKNHVGLYPNLAFSRSTKMCSNMTGLFYGFKGECIYNLEFVDTTGVNNMDFLFCNCNNLKKLNISTWNISNVKDSDFMFDGCTNMVSAKLNLFDSSENNHSKGVKND